MCEIQISAAKNAAGLTIKPEKTPHTLTDRLLTYAVNLRTGGTRGLRYSPIGDRWA